MTLSAKNLTINASSEGVKAAELINSREVSPTQVMKALDTIFKNGAVGSRFHLNSLEGNCGGRFSDCESEFYKSETKIYQAGGQFIWSATEEGSQFWSEVFNVVDVLSGDFEV